MKVLWVDDGIAALDRLAHGGFDLLITDVRLDRGGDGWSSAQLARQERPSLPVIFMTDDDRVTVRAETNCCSSHVRAARSRRR